MYFLRDGDTVLNELNAAFAATARYVNFPGEWGGLVSERIVGGSRFYATDFQGHARALLDASQAVTDTLLADAWGVEIAASGTSANPYRAYAQWLYYRDAANRLKVGLRDLRTDQGRWMSRDPIGYEGGDWNLYRYATSNPIAVIDPEGLAGCAPPQHPPDDRRKPPDDICTGRPPVCRPVYMTCDPRMSRRKGLAVYCSPDQTCSGGWCAVKGKRVYVPALKCGTFCKKRGKPLGAPVSERDGPRGKPNVVCVYGIHGPQQYPIVDCGCGQEEAYMPKPDQWADPRAQNCGGFEDGWRCICPGPCP